MHGVLCHFGVDVCNISDIKQFERNFDAFVLSDILIELPGADAKHPHDSVKLPPRTFRGMEIRERWLGLLT